MIARIRSGKSIRGAINYNEQKVKEGKATFIAAHLYPKDKEQLNFMQKLNRLQRLADLNTRTTTNCLHVSLNFDPKEQINQATLQKIAKEYMEKIGFGKQPYLVYEHHDAAHQHMHIVSTNVQKDGKRISLHNLGKDLSEKARQEIEINFNLVKAGGKQQKQLQQLTAIKPGKIEYGKAATKLAISNVVNHVVSQYKFATLHELNAILQTFNVTADRGVEGTRMYNNKGLLYSIIDSNKDKIGVPVKASSMYGKPTLKILEEKFEVNKVAKQQHIPATKLRVTDAMDRSASLQQFQSLLKEQNIDLVLRTNKDQLMYGITYIDHNNKTVFNGSELGKQFSAAFIRTKFAAAQVPATASHNAPIHATQNSVTYHPTSDPNYLSILTDTHSSFSYVPHQFKKKRKRKKRAP